jgi:ferredoxin
MVTEIAQIDQARCSGCGRCISACEFRLFSFETKAWKKTSVLHDIDRCNGCGECASQCIIGALSMVEKSEAGLAGISWQHGLAANLPKAIIGSTC